jgi:hypothetical protein
VLDGSDRPIEEFVQVHSLPRLERNALELGCLVGRYEDADGSRVAQAVVESRENAFLVKDIHRPLAALGVLALGLVKLNGSGRAPDVELDAFSHKWRLDPHLGDAPVQQLQQMMDSPAQLVGATELRKKATRLTHRALSPVCLSTDSKAT